MQQQADQDINNTGTIISFYNGNLFVTYVIMGINILMFILMAMNGAGIIDANSMVHINWGSNYTPLTLGGEWWRLLTNVFIHFGIIHLAINMYCLYTVGIYLEPMLGKQKYIIAYLCTGVLASITSLWWHKDGVNSAGASGAIFGLYGLFLVMLTTKIIPKQVRQPLLQSIAIFVIFNLIYGMKGGVDNSAHVGGLVSGFVIGYIYVYALKKERQDLKKVWLLPIIIGTTIICSYLYLDKNKVSAAEHNKALAEVKEATYKDQEKFEDKYNLFIELQDKALAVISDSTLKEENYLQHLNETAMPQWVKAEELAKEMKTMDVSDSMKQKAVHIMTYIQLRKEELGIRKEMIANKSEALHIKLYDIINRINEEVEKLR